MSVKAEVDQLIRSYPGDDLQFVSVGFELWDDFCRETGLTPQPVELGGNDVEVLYHRVSVRPGATPDTINLVAGS